jgi:competence transcription factor ComK
VRLARFTDSYNAEVYVNPRFTDSYNAEVYVNPDLVTFIRQSSNDVTTINFGEEHTVTVNMQVGAVASALFNAGKP